MKLLQAEMISHRNGKSIIKCTWQVKHGWLARLTWKLPKVEKIEVTYIGNSTIWRLLETYQRCSTQLESKLSDMEAYFLYLREQAKEQREAT